MLIVFIIFIFIFVVIVFVVIISDGFDPLVSGGDKLESAQICLNLLSVFILYVFIQNRVAIGTLHPRLYSGRSNRTNAQRCRTSIFRGLAWFQILMPYSDTLSLNYVLLSRDQRLTFEPPAQKLHRLGLDLIGDIDGILKEVLHHGWIRFRYAIIRRHLN